MTGLPARSAAPRGRPRAALLAAGARLCQTSQMPRRTLAIALIVTQSLLFLPGCVSVRETGTHAATEPGGGVAVQVFADDGARKAKKPGPSGVLGELDRREHDAWVPVFRSLDPVWAVAGLPPGRYRLRVPARLDDAGNVVRIDEKATELKVRDGQVTDAAIVLSHVDTGAIVVGVVAVAVAAVLLHDWLKHHDLPKPPPPPPPPPGLTNAAVWLSIDLHGTTGWNGPADREPPMVTSHFPTTGALVAARRPKVVLSFSEPLKADPVESAAITVLSEKGGLIPGQISYDQEHWWVVWEPQSDLPRGDTVHVTLAAGAVEDLAGNEMDKPVSFTFTTAS